MPGKILRIFYKATRVVHSPPVNLQPEDAHLFQNDYQIHLPESALSEIHHAVVTDLGIIYQNLRSLKENIICYDADFKRYQTRYLLKSLLRFKKRRFRGQNALIVFDNYSGPNGFAHWICDGLTRLAELNDELKNYTLIVPEYFREQAVYTESLKLFNTGKIHFLPPHSATWFSRLYFPSHIGDTGNFHPANIAKLREIVTRGLPSPGTVGRNIYISRAKARRRFVENETEVLTLLRRYNFEIVFMEDHLFPEQVNLIRSARNIVSIHGAALALLMFANPGTGVLELRSYDDATNNMYFLLAGVCDLRYYYLRCKSNPRANAANNFDLHVDLAALERNIQQLPDIAKHE